MDKPLLTNMLVPLYGVVVVRFNKQLWCCCFIQRRQPWPNIKMAAAQCNSWSTAVDQIDTPQALEPNSGCQAR